MKHRKPVSLPTDVAPEIGTVFEAADYDRESIKQAFLNTEKHHGVILGPVTYTQHKRAGKDIWAGEATVVGRLDQ